MIMVIILIITCGPLSLLASRPDQALETTGDQHKHRLIVINNRLYMYIPIHTHIYTYLYVHMLLLCIYKGVDQGCRVSTLAWMRWYGACRRAIDLGIVMCAVGEK